MLFGAIFRFILDIQGVDPFLGFANPFQAGRSATFFLGMLPYLMVIIVVVVGSREAARKRVGAPAALGRPYVRGERGAWPSPSLRVVSSRASRPSSSIWT